MCRSALIAALIAGAGAATAADYSFHVHGMLTESVPWQGEAGKISTFSGMFSGDDGNGDGRLSIDELVSFSINLVPFHPGGTDVWCGPPGATCFRGLWEFEFDVASLAVLHWKGDTIHEEITYALTDAGVSMWAKQVGGASYLWIEEPIVIAVPEPSTWLLMLAGVAGLGLARSRHQRPLP